MEEKRDPKSERFLQQGPRDPKSGQFLQQGHRGRRFKAGQSGNPGGRPAIAKEVSELARTYSTEAIEGLRKIAMNGKAPAQARVAAWNALLDRGIGKPVQAVDISRKLSLDGMTDDEIADALAAIQSICPDGAESPPANGAGETEH